MFSVLPWALGLCIFFAMGFEVDVARSIVHCAERHMHWEKDVPDVLRIVGVPRSPEEALKSFVPQPPRARGTGSLPEAPRIRRPPGVVGWEATPKEEGKHQLLVSSVAKGQARVPPLRGNKRGQDELIYSVVAPGARLPSPRNKKRAKMN